MFCLLAEIHILPLLFIRRVLPLATARLLCGSREDLEQPAVWSHVGIIFVQV